MKISRREWLWLAGAFGAARLCGQQAAPASEPLFAEVTASTSGIEWVHDNAISANHYLPETLGPGCAFLDFDNDGWVDLFLVNSGHSDFWAVGPRALQTTETALSRT
jgi:hypothetical protein